MQNQNLMLWKDLSLETKHKNSCLLSYWKKVYFLRGKQMYKIVEIYELLDSDFYKNQQPTGKFFTSYKEAMKFKDINPKDLCEHLAVKLDDGSYLLVKSASPIYPYNSPMERKKRVDELIGKLTPEEYELLEDYFGCER